MGLSARVPSGAQTYKFIPAIYLNKVIEAAKSSLVALDAVNNEWVAGAVKGDTYYIPKTNTVTATEVVVNTKGTSKNPFNTAGVTLSVDQWYEAPVDIDDMTKFQSQVAMDNFAVKESAYSIQKIIDTSICTLFSSLGGYSSSAYETDGQTLDDNILIYLMETLDEADVPRDGGRTLILDPSAMADMLKIDKFVQSLYVSIGAVENGLIAKNHPIYGCSVRVTNNLVAATTGNYGVMMHRNAIAVKIQIDTAWRKVFEELHTTRYQAEALWGVIEAQDTFGVPFYTRKS